MSKDYKMFITGVIEQRPQDYGQDVLRVYSQRLASEDALIREQQIQIVLKPAPKLIPKRLWLKLASKFIQTKEWNKV